MGLKKVMHGSLIGFCLTKRAIAGETRPSAGLLIKHGMESKTGAIPLLWLFPQSGPNSILSRFTFTCAAEDAGLPLPPASFLRSCFHCHGYLLPSNRFFPGVSTFHLLIAFKSLLQRPFGRLNTPCTQRTILHVILDLCNPS